MTEAKYKELINKEVDGMISEEEKNQLRGYLKENPQAEIIYQEMIKTSELRNQVEDIDPSPNLKKNVLNVIDSDRYRSLQNENIERLSLVDWLIRLNPRVAYGFAAGLILGLIVYALFLTDMTQKNDLDNSHIFGTMGIPESANVQKLDQVPLDLPGIRGDVDFFKFGKVVGFEIKTITSIRCEVAFSFDPSKVSFASFKPLDHSITTVENKKDKLNITINENSHFLLLFIQESTESTGIDLELQHTAETPFTYNFLLRSESTE